jgi:hypothetical protein
MSTQVIHLKSFSTEQYGVYKDKTLKLKPPMIEFAQKFTQAFCKSESVLFLVNERKVLLNQIYRNLFLHLKGHTNIKVDYIDNIQPGKFTNYNSQGYTEPKSVFIFLTKKHNLKELRVLNQLKKRNYIVNIISLGLDYYYPKYSIFCIDKIKTLYWFMYALLNQKNIYTYSDFSKLFKFTPKKFDFEEQQIENS